MNISQLKKQLIDHESMKLELYKCTAGFWTIGVGRNLSSRGISVETAVDMLDEDIEICISELDKVFPWWRRGNDARQHALIDLHFNLGINTLLSFKKTMNLWEEAVHGRVNWSQVADELLNSNYAKQLPNRSKTIATMIETGELQ
jgi:lysozyme|tara:strand:- start:5703 stop:6137 length:435 start_codon:yes stop_codon:yes gene_type:complete